MTFFYLAVILLIVIAAVLLAIAAMHYDPQRLHGRILRRMVGGFCLLLCWNLISGMQLGVNLISAFAAGCLGLPGLGLLSVMAMLP